MANYNIPINDQHINNMRNENNIINNIPRNEQNRNYRMNLIDNLFDNIINNGELNMVTTDELMERFNVLHNRRRTNIIEAQVQTINTLRLTNRRRTQEFDTLTNRFNHLLHQTQQIQTDNVFINIDVPADDDNDDDNDDDDDDNIDPSGNTFPQEPQPPIPSTLPPPLPQAPRRAATALPPAPRHPTEQVQVQTQCCVCMNIPANYANTSCGHCCLCINCVAPVRNICPICRAHGPYVRIIHS